jgi:hypothetical protein
MVDAYAPTLTARRTARNARKARRRPRVPTSLVVALLGIALGSWLLPALTRQWDDRQKAGDLKAAVVSQMATATGRALMAAQAAAAVPPDERPSSGTSPAAWGDWKVAALEIRARLDTYFGVRAVDRWALVTQYIDSALARAYASRTETFAVLPGYRLAPTSSDRLATLFGQYSTGDAQIDGLVDAILDREQRDARDILAMHVHGYSTTWRDVVSDLFPVV